MSETERRYLSSAAECRASGQGSRTIGGKAVVFNKLSSNLGGFVEQVNSRALNKSRGDGWPDVMARHNHSDAMLLGTVRGGTLRLTVDESGLDYEVDVPDTRQDVFELVQRGDVAKSSFAFRTFDEDWDLTEDNFPLRTLLSVQLVDVATVTIPAYPDSSSGLRSLAAAKGADFEEVRALAAQNELRKLFKRTDRPSKVTVAQARMELLARKNSPYL